jgi:clusterin-associated protein 1
MNEMEDTVKQLKQDENELDSKIKRRKVELERADKRLKGIENVKPEYQDEYERLEAELERFYNIYVEKFANIDFLEYEIDMYNLKDTQRKEDQKKMIGRIKGEQAKKDHNEIFNDDEERANGKGGKDDMFSEMRETKTGFGAKVNKKEFNPG